MAADVALPFPVASPLGALPYRDCGATMRRLPGRYWFRVAGWTAVHALGTVLNSPGRSVVTNPAPELGAGLPPPSMTSTPATIRATATTAPPQIQRMRDLRRERAAALRLRDPAGTGPWPGSGKSSQPVTSGAGASSTARCPPWLPALGLPCARRCRVSWPAHRGVTPGPAQGGYSSSVSNCSSQERRPVARESPRRPAVGGLPDQGGGDPCSAKAPHFMASLAGASLASGGRGGGPGVVPRASRVSPPGHRNGAWGALCGVRPGGCGVTLDKECLILRPS